MTNEPNSSEGQTTTEAWSKLLVDRPADFRFHAAYLIYSSAWDRTSSQEIRKKLNELIDALSKNQIEYEKFYHEINQYRAEYNPEHFTGGTSKAFIETQRKRDWRRREERDRRNARHGR